MFLSLGVFYSRRPSVFHVGVHWFPTSWKLSELLTAKMGQLLELKQDVASIFRTGELGILPSDLPGSRCSEGHSSLREHCNFPSSPTLCVGKRWQAGRATHLDLLPFCLWLESILEKMDGCQGLRRTDSRVCCLYSLMIPAHSWGGVGPLPFHMSPSEEASWWGGDSQAGTERTGRSTMDSHHSSCIENPYFPKSWLGTSRSSCR